MTKHGGLREGAGRKAKADELKLAESIDLALGDKWVSDLLKKIHEAAKKGSFQHAQLLLAYKYGKPQENVYIGCGRGYRPYQKAVKNRTKSWLDATANRPFAVQILHECYTSAEAFALEKVEIAAHRKANQPLINKTLGGPGTTGLKRPPLSEEVRLRISNKLKGRPLTKEALRKRSATIKGKPLSPETKAKRDAMWAEKRRLNLRLMKLCA